MLDYGMFPPEFNSARMYTGAGSAPMLAAAAAWNGLASELRSNAGVYQSIISRLTGEGWLGPASTAMAAAATPYATWMDSTAAQAEQTAAQANAAASAYETAYAATVPPPVIAANRAQLQSLIATNVFGQNAPAIAAVEALYGEMWAQDADAMYVYAAQSAAASKVTPFTTPAQTVNANGLIAQNTATANAVGSATGTGTQQTLSQLVTTVPNALQSMASPAASTSGSGLGSVLGSVDPFAPGSNTATTGFAGFLNMIDGSTGSSVGTFLSSGLGNGIISGGYFSPVLASPAVTSALADINSLRYDGMNTGNSPFPDFMPPNLGGGSGVPALSSSLAAPPSTGLPGAAAVSAGLGRATLVGSLSVPQSWAPANAVTTPAATGLQTAGWNGAQDLVPASAAGTPGMPGMPGMPMGTYGGRGGFAFAAPRYGFRPTVMAQPPAAG